ncbi:MAG: CdaR family protein [Roseburia sp.]|nr:CdaR family protein [Roseburia sp.]
MRKKILHNWGLKLASLLLAFVLWFLVVGIDDPLDTANFSNISVRLVNTELLDNEDKVFEVLAKTDTVRVTVRAPRSVLQELRSTDIMAEADVSKLTDINTIEISYYVQNANVESIRGDHDFVRLSVEERLTRTFRVQCTTRGEVAEGYLVAGITPDQNRVDVTGPRSQVERISYIGVEVDISNAVANVFMTPDIHFYDAEDNLLSDLSNVTPNVSAIHTSVEVLATKEVPVELNVMGVPADGYVATGQIVCEPSSVRVAGSVAALAALTKISVPEEVLNITGASSNMTTIINIRDYLPEGVRLEDSASSGKITAEVFVEPLVERTYTLTAEDFELLNGPEGYEMEILEPEEQPYELTIIGLEAAVAAVAEDTVRGTADLEDWMSEEEISDPGNHTYRIPVTFSLPENVEIRQEVTVMVHFYKAEVM